MKLILLAILAASFPMFGQECSGGAPPPPCPVISTSPLTWTTGEFTISKYGNVLAKVDQDGKVSILGSPEDIVLVVWRAILDQSKYLREQYDRDEANRKNLEAAHQRYEKSLEDVVAAQNREIGLLERLVALYKKSWANVVRKGANPSPSNLGFQAGIISCGKELMTNCAATGVLK